MNVPSQFAKTYQTFIPGRDSGYQKLFGPLSDLYRHLYSIDHDFKLIVQDLMNINSEWQTRLKPKYDALVQFWESVVEDPTVRHSLEMLTKLLRMAFLILEHVHH